MDEFGHEFVHLWLCGSAFQAAIAENSILVVVAGLMEPDLGFRNFVNESMFLADSTRPKTGQIELEQFRFADSGKWIL
jgi:hypothetical protein